MTIFSDCDLMQTFRWWLRSLHTVLQRFCVVFREHDEFVFISSVHTSDQTALNCYIFQVVTESLSVLCLCGLKMWLIHRPYRLVAFLNKVCLNSLQTFSQFSVALPSHVFCPVHPEPSLNVETVPVSHHFVELCFGSLSCCKMNLWPTGLSSFLLLSPFLTTLLYHRKSPGKKKRKGGGREEKKQNQTQ